MSKIVVDQIQKLGGTAVYNIPTSDGLNGQYVKTDGSGNLGFASMTDPSGGTIDGLVAPEGKDIVGSIVTHSDRYNIYGTPEWASSGPWTTWVNADAYADNTAIQWMNLALGDAMGSDGSSQGFLSDTETQYSRQLQFAQGARLGYNTCRNHYSRNRTGYAGLTLRVMPVRNTSGSPITVNFYAYASDYWEQGYEGSCLFVFYPNTSTYSTVSSVSSTRISYSTNTTMQNNLTGSYTIPANTTVLVCLTSTDRYWTSYQFVDCNYFYNLGTTFSNSNIICDMRMLSSLYASRFNFTYAGAFSTYFPTLWTKTATNYGDR